MPSFYHCPNIGDIIYALAVVRHLGGGSLHLDSAPNPAYKAVFEGALSFFRRQPYITQCQLYAGEKYDYNLDNFRHVPLWWHMTQVESHFRGIGVDPAPVTSPWLVASKQDVTYPIILHRSFRYHGIVDYMFLHKIAPTDLFCVGYEEEATDFCEAFGATWLPTSDIDSLAEVINSCGVFIGNQSTPLAIAAGLGKNRLIEECPWIPDCTYYHPNEYRLGTGSDKNLQALQSLGYPTATSPQGNA